jgi:hypothetical protein
MVSYIAIPAVTDPPGELMYKEIGFFGFSASKKSNCATISAEVASCISPLSRIILSFSSLENISKTLSPLDEDSTTYGIEEIALNSFIKFFKDYFPQQLLYDASLLSSTVIFPLFDSLSCAVSINLFLISLASVKNASSTPKTLIIVMTRLLYDLQ